MCMQRCSGGLDALQQDVRAIFQAGHLEVPGAETGQLACNLGRVKNSQREQTGLTDIDMNGKKQKER